MIDRFLNEKFLTLHIGSLETSALYFHLEADRKIVVEKFEEKIDLKEFLDSPLRRAANASWEGKNFVNHRRRMLAVASADRATTIPVPLIWKRDAIREQTPLMLDEIDDHIGRALPKIITACRAEAAGRFGADPIDAVLVAMRATNVAVDGRHAANVAGFFGSEISLVLDLTFAHRDVFDTLNQLFKGPDGFFFMEAPQAELQVLSLVRPLPLNLILPSAESPMMSSLFVLEKAGTYVGNSRNAISKQFRARAVRSYDGIPSGSFEEDRTSLAAETGRKSVAAISKISPLEKYSVLYREKFLWSFEPIIGSIRSEFSVSRVAAGEMYAAFVRGDVSADVARGIGAIIKPHLESFEIALQKAKVHGATFMPTEFDLPYEFPYHIGKAVVEPTRTVFKELLNTFDLHMDRGSMIGREDILFQHFAPFFLMYFDRAHGALDERLRRRVHWLAG